MADEQKKIFPDCWKRKRTLTSTSASTSSSTSLSSKTAQHIPSSSLETQTTTVATSLGIPSFSLGNRHVPPPSCLSGASSSTNIIMKNIEDSKAGSDNMIHLGNSTNIDITVPK